MNWPSDLESSSTCKQDSIYPLNVHFCPRLSLRSVNRNNLTFGSEFIFSWLKDECRSKNEDFTVYRTHPEISSCYSHEPLSIFFVIISKYVLLQPSYTGMQGQGQGQNQNQGQRRGPQGQYPPPIPGSSGMASGVPPNPFGGRGPPPPPTAQGQMVHLPPKTLHPIFLLISLSYFSLFVFPPLSIVAYK